MKKETSEYIVRDFSAVDRQVEEMANREKALTWRLKIENVKRLGIPLILLSCALSILLLAFGAFIWLIQQERIVEIEKIVEVTREVPIISDRIKVVEVPYDDLVDEVEVDTNDELEVDQVDEIEVDINEGIGNRKI